MNINILSNLFNKNGGPTGTGGCSDEDQKQGKCTQDLGLRYTSSTHGGLISPQFNEQGGSYFPGASRHKGALYAHKARHNIK